MHCAREMFFAIAIVAACDDGSGPTDDGAGTEVDTDDDAGDESSGSGSTGDDGPWASLEERPCPEDSDVTWENFGGGYVISYCTTCHHSALPSDMRQLAPIAMNFETLEMVRMHAPRMWARAGDQNATMPPVGAPGEDERALFGEWLACGAPTNADLGME
jgi:hypothetical protein